MTDCVECGRQVLIGIDGNFCAHDPDEFPMHDACADRLQEIIMLEAVVNPLPIEWYASLCRRVAKLLDKDEEWVQKILAEKYS